jgi:phosphopantothenoylcysteine decarboxylase/phosphopantothenate--cysteine ligase
MKRKGCDLMVMNNPTRRGSEFGGDTNEVVLLHRDGREEKLPLLPKADVARAVLERALALLPQTGRPNRRKKA